MRRSAANGLKSACAAGVVCAQDNTRDDHTPWFRVVFTRAGKLDEEGDIDDDKRAPSSEDESDYGSSSGSDDGGRRRRAMEAARTGGNQDEDGAEDPGEVIKRMARNTGPYQRKERNWNFQRDARRKFNKK